MSRNLTTTSCYFCPGNVVMTEKPRQATEDDCWGDFLTMIVAHAECAQCKAKYLAWVDWPEGDSYWHNSDHTTFVDLSFRSTFNDEPGAEDLPEFEVTERTIYVKKPWPRCPSCGGKKYMTYGCKNYGRDCV